MDWLERNFGKLWIATAIVSVIVSLALTGLAIWGVISLVNWVVSQ